VRGFPSLGEAAIVSLCRLKLLHLERTGGMTTILQSQPRATDNLEIIDCLFHEIQNNLQVIRMEAELSVIEQITTPGSQCAFAATEKIEGLLEEVRKWFLQRR
jgi:hypothetical protein